MRKRRIGFYSVDVTISEDGKPYLIEINGSNSGFDGFLIAYNDTSMQDKINLAFEELVGARRVYVITRLVNFGQLPEGYLDKLVQDLLYFRSIDNIHAMLNQGTTGRMWARMRTDRPPSTVGAGTSLDKLVESYPRFKKVMLNVADPRYVISAEYFNEEHNRGIISFKKGKTGTVQAIALEDEDVLWIRCPTIAFSEPIARGIQVNPEFPNDAIADNKWFTYEVLSPEFSENIPVSVPIGMRCSGSAVIGEMLTRSNSDLFIQKPLLGSQARGLEILRRRDVEDYHRRIAQLERADNEYAEELPLELRGVPALHAAWALSFELSLLGELTPSKPVYCRWTGRYHYGCMRTLGLVEEDENKSVEVRFLGAYWRLAPVPIDGDGLLWERYVASQSQGAFCEQVSSDDIAIAERFSKDVLAAYCRKLSVMPRNRQDYEEWEKNYWLARWREQVPFLQYGKPWSIFLAEISKAQNEALQTKERARLAGFSHNPAAFLTEEQVIRARLPYLIEEPHRIVIP